MRVAGVQLDIAWQEGIVAGDVDPGLVERTRATLRFLDDRRPRVYAQLGE